MSQPRIILLAPFPSMRPLQPHFHPLPRPAQTLRAIWVIALAAWQAGHTELVRSPRLALAHVWEGREG